MLQCMDQKEVIDVVTLLKITMYEVDLTIFDFNNLKHRQTCVLRMAGSEGMG